MAKLYDERIIDMPAAEFYALQNDPDFEAFQARWVKYAAYEETSRSEIDGGLRRTIHMEPDVALPSALQKFVRRRLGNNGFYLLETREVPDEGLSYSWQVEPPVFSDRILIQGEFRVEALDDNRCKRVIDGEFTVKLSGVGALIGKFAARELTRGYDQIPEIAAAWSRGER